jgi:hypothetical protein
MFARSTLVRAAIATFRLQIASGVFVLTGPALACSQDRPPATPSDGPQTVTVATVASRPEDYVGKTFRITGTLENQGSNYFTDLRVVLRDAQGNAIRVRPWLPASLPPGPSRPPGSKTPATLSQFLGKKVELTSEVAQGQLPPRDEKVYFLDVKSARVVE